MYSEQLKTKIRELGFRIEREVSVDEISTNYIVSKRSEEDSFVLKIITVYSEEEKEQLKSKFKIYKDITEKYSCYMVQVLESYWIPGESEYEEKMLISTQYCPSLKELRAKRNLFLKDVIRIGIHIGTALSYLYQEGMQYEGLTEEVIYYDEKSDCYKLDYCLIKPNEKKFVYYMAPEWFDTKEYTEQNNIYSLGILLYRLLNEGYFPFEDKYETREEAEKARKKSKFPDLKFGTYYLNQVIQKACDKKENRFENMNELVHSLKNIYCNLKEDWRNSLLNCYYRDEENSDWDNNLKEDTKEEKYQEPISRKKKEKRIQKPIKKKQKKPKIEKKEGKQIRSFSFKEILSVGLIIILSVGIIILSGIFLFQSKNHKIQSYIDSKSYSAAVTLIREEYESGKNVDKVTENFIELCMDQTEENKIVEVIDCFQSDYYEKNQEFFCSVIEELGKRGKEKALGRIKTQLKEKTVPANLMNEIEKLVGKEE